MTNRRSRWFPSEPKKWVSSHQTDLLYQDFVNRIVPYRHDPKAYELSTVGAHYYQVNKSLRVGNHWHGLDGFLRAVASKLLASHEVWLEVNFENENRDRAPFAISEVLNVSRTETGDLIQKLPNRDELPNWFRGGEEWESEVELDGDRMIHVLLPEAYSSQLLMQVVWDLAEIDPNVTPAWVMEQLADQNQDASPFDFSEAYRTERLRIAQAARPIGWTAREVFGSSTRQMGEYYYHWREFRFLHFRSSMRACAEEALRQTLALASAACGFTASVTAHGVHTPHQVQRLMRRFEEGQLPLSALNNILYEKAAETTSEPRQVV